MRRSDKRRHQAAESPDAASGNHYSAFFQVFVSKAVDEGLGDLLSKDTG